MFRLAKLPPTLIFQNSFGDANATRAVGNANGSNPIAVIVPCHRIIGTSRCFLRGLCRRN